jgi:hypothetical protein
MLAPSPSRDPLPVAWKPMYERILEAAAAIASELNPPTGPVAAADLTGSRRLPHIVNARHAAMMVMRSMNSTSAGRGPWSFQEIGRRVGNRDHASVIFAVRSTEKDIAAGRTGEGTRPWLVARIKERVGL